MVDKSALQTSDTGEPQSGQEKFTSVSHCIWVIYLIMCEPQSFFSELAVE